jgi:hypothetical protein
MFNFVAFLAWIVSLSVWIGMMFCSANIICSIHNHWFRSEQALSAMGLN